MQLFELVGTLAVAAMMDPRLRDQLVPGWWRLVLRLARPVALTSGRVALLAERRYQEAVRP
jgi:uncharacterized membrane protein YhaH (DUF805 family)